MSLVVERGEPVLVICDGGAGCGSYFTAWGSAHHAAEQAEADGWDVHSNERAFCPDHKETS